jgi:hypothetical protein
MTIGSKWFSSICGHHGNHGNGFRFTPSYYAGDCVLARASCEHIQDARGGLTISLAARRSNACSVHRFKCSFRTVFS